VTVDVAKVLKSVQANEIKVDMTVTYKGWAVNGELSGDAFIFTPPKDAKKVDSFEPKRPEPAASGLKGKPAPAFTLDLAGGGTFDLAQQKGKNVVILDFWASWCGPCRQAMPIYAKVASEYKDKGVVFYGVNIAESPETIKKFLEQTKLEIAVAMDAEGKVAGQYQAASIPMSVIIDKTGVVQVVHVGLAPNLETELRAELDAILAGKPVEE
jgi:thiol-disulfide isomerase/thioredoxin